MQQRRHTHQRQLILDAVRNRCDHPTADDVYLDVRSQDERISRATVYRNLHLLAEAGSITSVKAPGGERFDKRQDEHGHVVCRLCGLVADVPVPCLNELDRSVEAATGFEVISHETLFSGLCPECQKTWEQDEAHTA